MNKLGEFIGKLSVKVNVPMTMFVLFSTRLVIFGSGIGEAIALISIAAVYGYYLYIKRNQDTRFLAFTEELTRLKDAIASLKMERSVKRGEDGSGKRFF